ncbi:hypothetical protein BX666DRAFT_1885644 [Dichotomocladium elegans]|nr:hypothetical protein BX666DRAFT_1885644 [Dichotomocladium elegans]
MASSSAYVRTLYRRLLCEGSQFFDARARTFIINRARTLFRQNQSLSDETRLKNKLHEARKALHRIERANQGNVRSAFKLLEHAYGRRGKARHRLLHPYVHAHIPADLPMPAPFVPHVPHTAPPPPLCQPLKVIITQVLRKNLEPTLPQPRFKPLHPGRKANLLWRWRSDLLDRVPIPLPFEIGCELEHYAGAASADHPLCAAHLQRGGPRWSDLYRTENDNPHLAHLNPDHRLIPLSRVKRSRHPLPVSPYAAPPSPYDTMTILQLVDPDLENHRDGDGHHGNDLQRQRHGLSPRARQRLYRRLLADVPMLWPLPTAYNLWDETVRFQVETSFLKIGRIQSLEEPSASA